MKKQNRLVAIFLLICLAVNACSAGEGQPVEAPASAPGVNPNVELTPLAPHLNFRIINQDYQGEYVYRDPIQTPVSSAWGPDGMLYIADVTGCRIMRMTPQGEVSQLAITTDLWDDWRDGGPHLVEFSPEVRLYFADIKHIYSFEDDSSAKVLITISEAPIGDIAFSPDGVLYYTKRDPGNGQVRRLKDGSSEQVVENLPYAEYLAFGLDGSLYVSQMNAGKVYKVNVETGATELFYSQKAADQIRLEVDAEGDVWISSQGTLLQVSPDGTVKPFLLDGTSQAKPGDFRAGSGDLSFDAQGNLWLAFSQSIITKFTPKIVGAQDPDFNSGVVYQGIFFTSLVVNPQGEFFGIDQNSGKFMKLSSGQLVEIIAAGSGNPTLAIHPDGTIYLRRSDGMIYTVFEDSVTPTNYDRIYLESMVFAQDGLLYAIASENPDGGQRRLVKFDQDGKAKTLATSIDGTSLGISGAKISAGSDGLYIFVEDGPYLFKTDFNGRGSLLATQPELASDNVVMRAPIAATSDGRVFLIYMHKNADLVFVDQAGTINEFAYAVRIGEPRSFVLSPDGKWLYIPVVGGIIKIQIVL